MLTIIKNKKKDLKTGLGIFLLILLISCNKKDYKYSDYEYVYLNIQDENYQSTVPRELLIGVLINNKENEKTIVNSSLKFFLSDGKDTIDLGRKDYPAEFNIEKGMSIIDLRKAVDSKFLDQNYIEKFELYFLDDKGFHVKIKKHNDFTFGQYPKDLRQKFNMPD